MKRLQDAPVVHDFEVWFDKKWNDPDAWLEMAPPKEVMSELNPLLQPKGFGPVLLRQLRVL